MLSIIKLQSYFKSTFERADKEVEKILENIIKEGIKLDSRSKFYLQFVLRELFNNAVEHGNKMDVNKEVQYCLEISKDLFEIQVTDCGDGFQIMDIMESEKNNSVIRERNRGISTLVDMGFIINTSNSGIQAKLNLEKFFIMEERSGNKMNITIENGVANCVITTSLVTVNVKDMVEIAKKRLEGDEMYDSVVINLEASESVDSMGITFLIGMYKTITAKGKTISLSGVSEEMMNLFKIMKLDEIFAFEK